MTAGNQNHSYHIANAPFARGGEGCVHDVIGRPGLVAKIYHPAGRTPQRQEKIKAMLQSPPGGALHAQIAWPQDILYDLAGRFLGFVMPRIQNVSKIDVLYSYDNRGAHPFSWYLQVARNLCAAVNSVHESGHVVGDLNPANICVDPETTLVTLVDTDSYSVRGPGGRIYRCTVCRQEYVPAELHRLLDSGANLKTVQAETFTRETDLFALALHLFALLMNGCHPYACTVQQSTQEARYNLLQNIRQGYFPFTEKTSGVGIPRYAPPLSALPPDIRQLCVRAFAQGSRNPALRPAATQWYGALQRLEGSLAQCPQNSAHQHWNALPACPLCATAAGMQTLLSAQEKALPAPHAPVPAKTPARTPAWRPPLSLGQRLLGALGGIGSGFLAVLLAIGGGAAALLGSVGKVALALVLWAGWNLLAQWLLLKVPLFTWWWWLIRYATLGIVPFVPLWVFAAFAAVGFYFAEDMANLYAKITRWLTLIVYAGLALWAGVGHGLMNMLLWPVLLCLPVVLMCKWLPGLTWDMDL